MTHHAIARVSLLPALLLSFHAPLSTLRTAGLYNYRRIFVAASLRDLGLGSGSFILIEFLQEVGLDSRPSLLPPILLRLCRGLQFSDSFLEYAVLIHLVRRLKDDLAPVGRKSVSLEITVSRA